MYQSFTEKEEIRYKGDLLGGIGSCSYGAEKSHYLLLESWRPRKTGGVIQLESEGLKTRQSMIYE